MLRATSYQLSRFKRNAAESSRLPDCGQRRSALPSLLDAGEQAASRAGSGCGLFANDGTRGTRGKCAAQRTDGEASNETGPAASAPGQPFVDRHRAKTERLVKGM